MVYTKLPMATGQLVPLRFNHWSTGYLIFTLVSLHFIRFRYLDKSLLDKFISVTSTKQKDNCIQDGAGYLPVLGCPATFAYSRASAWCACSRCGTGVLYFSSIFPF